MENVRTIECGTVAHPASPGTDVSVAGIATVSNCERVGDEVLNGVPKRPPFAVRSKVPILGLLTRGRLEWIGEVSIATDLLWRVGGPWPLPSTRLRALTAPAERDLRYPSTA